MASLPPTNLAALTPSQRRLREGDLFVARPQTRPYVFGRVISTQADSGFGRRGAILIYVYDAWSDRKDRVPDISRDHLLIPPAMINRLGWSRGYFEVVSNRPLTPADTLPVHCFVDTRTRYFNEKGEPLPGPVEPVGHRGLGNYRTIDDAISRAIGMPLAPEG